MISGVNVYICKLNRISSSPWIAVSSFCFCSRPALRRSHIEASAREIFCDRTRGRPLESLTSQRYWGDLLRGLTIHIPGGAGFTIAFASSFKAPIAFWMYSLPSKTRRSELPCTKRNLRGFTKRITEPLLRCRRQSLSRSVGLIQFPIAFLF